MKTWKVVCSPEGGKVTTIEVCRADEARSQLDAATEERDKIKEWAFRDAPEWEKANVSLKHRVREVEAERDAAIAELKQERKFNERAFDQQKARAESAEAVARVLVEWSVAEDDRSGLTEDEVMELAKTGAEKGERPGPLQEMGQRSVDMGRRMGRKTIGRGRVENF